MLSHGTWYGSRIDNVLRVRDYRRIYITSRNNMPHRGKSPSDRYTIRSRLMIIVAIYYNNNNIMVVLYVPLQL